MYKRIELLQCLLFNLKEEGLIHGRFDAFMCINVNVYNIYLILKTFCKTMKVKY